MVSHCLPKAQKEGVHLLPARKSLAALALSGTLKNTPMKYAARVAEELGTAEQTESPGDLGDPPKHLHSGQKKAWNELRERFPWLTMADSFRVEQAARLLSASRNPKKTLASRDEKLLASLIDKLSKAPRAAKTATVPAATAITNLLSASLRPVTGDEPLPYADIPKDELTDDQLLDIHGEIIRRELGYNPQCALSRDTHIEVSEPWTCHCRVKCAATWQGVAAKTKATRPRRPHSAETKGLRK